MEFLIRNWSELPREKPSQLIRRLENMRSATPLIRMISLKEMRTVGWSLSTRTAQRWMWIGLQCQFCRVAQLVSRRIGRSEPSIPVRIAEESLSSVQWSFSTTSSLRRRITRKFKRLSSSGYYTKTTMQSSKLMLKRSLRSAKTSTFLILQR